MGAIGFFGKNIAATVDQEWVTLTHTITGAEVMAAGIEGMRLAIRAVNNSANATAGDLIHADNVKITAVPEPSGTALIGLLGVMGLARRRR